MNKSLLNLYCSSLLLIFLAFLSTDVSATRRYVNHSATGSNNGSSWTNAYINLDSPISVAGIYMPSIYPAGASGSNARDYSFYLAYGVHMYGGFAITGTTLAARNYATNAISQSGDIGTAEEQQATTEQQKK